jgi:hypothetical protein
LYRFGDNEVVIGTSADIEGDPLTGGFTGAGYSIRAVSAAAQAESTNRITTNDVVRLRVTVVDSVPLRSFRGSLTPTDDVNSRFALTLRIDSCVPAITNLKSGTVVTFAVHSPSRFLGGSAEKGETHEITMPRKKAANLVFDDKTKQANKSLQRL